MYVDFEYYSSVFGGSALTAGAFQKAAQEAEAYIRYLTYLKGDIFADMAQADAVKGAVCAAAEAWHAAMQEVGQGGNIKSESKDGFSMSFVVARKEGETADDYVKRCMYQALRTRLLPTGWFSRKVGCRDDHKCKSCDCL